MLTWCLQHLHAGDEISVTCHFGGHAWRACYGQPGGQGACSWGGCGPEGILWRNLRAHAAIYGCIKGSQARSRGVKYSQSLTKRVMGPLILWSSEVAVSIAILMPQNKFIGEESLSRNQALGRHTLRKGNNSQSIAGALHGSICAHARRSWNHRGACGNCRSGGRPRLCANILCGRAEACRSKDHFCNNSVRDSCLAFQQVHSQGHKIVSGQGCTICNSEALRRAEIFIQTNHD